MDVCNFKVWSRKNQLRIAPEPIQYSLLGKVNILEYNLLSDHECLCIRGVGPAQVSGLCSIDHT